MSKKISFLAASVVILNATFTHVAYGQNPGETGPKSTDWKVAWKITAGHAEEECVKLFNEKEPGLGTAIDLLYKGTPLTFGVSDTASIMRGDKHVIDEIVADRVKDAFIDLLKLAIKGVWKARHFSLVSDVLTGIFEATDIDPSSSLTVEQRQKAYAALSKAKHGAQLGFIDDLVQGNETSLDQLLENPPKRRSGPASSLKAHWVGMWQMPAVGDQPAKRVGVEITQVSNGSDGRPSRFNARTSSLLYGFKVIAAENNGGTWVLHCVSYTGNHQFDLTGNDGLTGEATDEFNATVRSGSVDLNRTDKMPTW